MDAVGVHVAVLVEVTDAVIVGVKVLVGEGVMVGVFDGVTERIEGLGVRI